jgi:hypothetical protein
MRNMNLTSNYAALIVIGFHKLSSAAIYFFHTGLVVIPVQVRKCFKNK